MEQTGPKILFNRNMFAFEFVTFMELYFHASNKMIEADS
jgi:hypothetical protein